MQGVGNGLYALVMGLGFLLDMIIAFVFSDVPQAWKANKALFPHLILSLLFITEIEVVYLEFENSEESNRWLFAV